MVTLAFSQSPLTHSDLWPDAANQMLLLLPFCTAFPWRRVTLRWPPDVCDLRLLWQTDRPTPDSRFIRFLFRPAETFQSNAQRTDMQRLHVVLPLSETWSCSWNYFSLFWSGKLYVLAKFGHKACSKLFVNWRKEKWKNCNWKNVWNKN